MFGPIIPYLANKIVLFQIFPKSFETHFKDKLRSMKIEKDHNLHLKIEKTHKPNNRWY